MIFNFKVLRYQASALGILIFNYSLYSLLVSNFVDLSGSCRSEGTVFDKLLKRLYERRTGTTYIPIKFLSLARNNLARAPYSSLSLLSTSLEYLSLAGNNFHSNVIKGMI